MDLVLDLADEYVLDHVYAALVPRAPAAVLSFAAAAASNASFGPANPAPSAWAQLTSFLPYAKDGLAHGLPARVGAPMVSAAVSAWPRDYVPRQVLSLAAITLVGVHILYFTFAYASYVWIFNHDMMKHPRFLKNQVRQEIQSSLRAMPVMTALTLPWFLAEARGHSLLYTGADTYGWPWLIAQVPVFLFLTDVGVYFVHRLEHHPALYKHIHKPHHKWIIPTPFASHAFHPLDGYAQSIPYHLIIFVLPFHRYLYLGLFVFVNLWSILIHDSDLITGHPLEKIINGPAHHTLHHLYFTVNYGQYFTWADRAGGSYRQPESADDPYLDVLKLQEAKKAR